MNSKAQGGAGLLAVLAALAILILALLIGGCTMGDVQAVPNVGVARFIGDEGNDTTAVSAGMSFYRVPEVPAPEGRIFPDPVAPTAPAADPAPAAAYDWPAAFARVQPGVPMASSSSEPPPEPVVIETDYGSVTLNASLGAAVMALAVLLHQRWGGKPKRKR